MRIQATRFNELVQFKAPDGFLVAVTTAARCEHTSMAEFLRRTVIARLREVGLPLDVIDQKKPALRVASPESAAARSGRRR